MNVVVVGGSSQSTPALFDTDATFDAENFTFKLVGRSQPRLAGVARAIDLIASARGHIVDCRCSTLESLEQTVADADVVLVQFRVKGYAARAWDESFPHRYGVCGDEGLGPGGLAAAWRTWGELREVLETIAQARPQAIVILLTSPIGILTSCARLEFPSLRVYGICELPWTTLQSLCDSAAADARRATFAYVGVNHFGWFSNVRDGENIVVSHDDIRPLKYVRLLDAPAQTLREQQAAPSRSRELEKLASAAFAAYASGEYSEIIAIVRRRQTAWYAQAVAPLLRALAGGTAEATFFLTAANNGYCLRFAYDEIIEIPHTVKAGRIQARPAVPWLRGDITDRLARLVAYERVAAGAVRSRDVAELRAALRLHPTLDGIEISDRLVADVIATVVPAA